jgi:hypothetical protein
MSQENLSLSSYQLRIALLQTALVQTGTEPAMIDM